MANVYLAVAQGPAGFNKLVVLKLLRPHLAADRETLDMFLHEARLAARLNHPNVVQTYEVGTEGGRHGLVMEYLEGQSLAAIWTRAGKMSAATTSTVRATEKDAGGRRNFPLRLHLRVVADALAGLHYAHELAGYDGKKLGLVHRDVSPHNVFVTYDGQVKLLDFGVAKASVGMGERTETGVIKGKLQYMSREQMAAEDVDRRADIFAIGTMLWEAATGRRLWRGVPEVAIMSRVLNGEIPRPTEIRSEISPELERIILKAMAHDRNDRYATASDLQSDIEALLTSMGDVKTRELGAFVTELFADVRSSMKSLIENRLSKVEDLPSADQGTLDPIALSKVPSLFGATSSGSDLQLARRTELSDSASVTGKRSSRSWLIAGLGLVLAIGATSLLWRASRSKTSASGPASIVASPPAAEVSGSAPSPPSLTAGADVKIHLETDPPGAKLYLDGAELPSDPFDTVVQRDREWHTIRAEARGRAPKEAHVSFDSDVWLSLKLDVVPTLVRNTPIPGVTQRPAAAPTPASTCIPPYYFEDGIKKIKRGCM
jgi:serine/threonine-protein kinase